MVFNQDMNAAKISKAQIDKLDAAALSALQASDAFFKASPAIKRYASQRYIALVNHPHIVRPAR